MEETKHAEVAGCEKCTHLDFPTVYYLSYTCSIMWKNNNLIDASSCVSVLYTITSAASNSVYKKRTSIKGKYVESWYCSTMTWLVGLQSLTQQHEHQDNVKQKLIYNIIKNDYKYNNF